MIFTAILKYWQMEGLDIENLKDFVGEIGFETRVDIWNYLQNVKSTSLFTKQWKIHLISTLIFIVLKGSSFLSKCSNKYKSQRINIEPWMTVWCLDSDVENGR